MNRFIAYFLFVLFSSFTVLFSTYTLWQDGEVLQIVILEEGEDREDSENKTAEEYWLPHFAFFMADETSCFSKGLVPKQESNNYEDVYHDTPYSPPDVYTFLI